MPSALHERNSASMSSKDAWAGGLDIEEPEEDSAAARMRERKLAQRRMLEEQRRRQRNSTAGRVFVSNSDIAVGARPQSRHGAKRQTSQTQGLLLNRRTSGERGSDEEEEVEEEAAAAASKKKQAQREAKRGPMPRSYSNDSLDAEEVGEGVRAPTLQGRDADNNSKTAAMLKEKGLSQYFDPAPAAAAADTTGPVVGPSKEEAAMANKANVSATLQAAGIEALDISGNLYDFVRRPAPKGKTVTCRIIRRKAGVEKSVFPTYCLYLEQPNNQKTFLLAGRKRKKSATSNYLISMDREDLARDSDNFLGKLRSNFVGTAFTIFDNGVNPKRAKGSDQVRSEIAAVQYDTNIMGWKGPRKMTVIIPGMQPDCTPNACQPKNDNESLLERYKDPKLNSDLLLLQNKAPYWNEDTQSYVLNFKGRVTMASVKNFQIVHADDLDYIVLQFGRIGEDAFNLDYQYPMNALQAFGIVLSSFDGKLACE